MVKCTQCNRQFKTQAALNQHRLASHSQPSNQPRRVAQARRQQPANPLREGELVIARSELLLALEVAQDATETASAHLILPSNSRLTWLNKLAASFDQIIWLSAAIVWKPAVGTTFNGSLIVGVDWNADANGTTRTTVQACVPHMDTPVWSKARMTIPTARLQSRRSYILKAAQNVDKAPGVILVNARTTKGAPTFLGDLWMEYKVRLMGPSA